jgi:hypothetical protein
VLALTAFLHKRYPVAAAKNFLCMAKTTRPATRFLRTQRTFPKWNRGPHPLRFAGRQNRGQEPLMSSFAWPIE